jgi:hypothetical protein
MKSMKLFAALTVAALCVAMAPQAALADSPKFQSASATLNSDGSLTANFRETGLGNTPTNVSYTATADAKATYACINGGGKHPSATNKETVNGPLSQNGSFPSSKNGVVIGAMTFGPLGAGSFTCPSGQSMVLAFVSYSNVQILDTDHNVSTTISGGPFTRCFVDTSLGLC